MNKSNSRLMQKKTSKIVLILIFLPITLFILIIAWVYFTQPFFDKSDQDRFTALDTQMQNLFNNLDTASNGTDQWKYSSSCVANKSGWMATGNYSCTASMSLLKKVNSVQEINNFQAKYYSLIDSDKTLSQITELDPQPPNDFGKNYVVSSAEKKYLNISSRIECDYLIKLFQNDKTADLSSSQYGSKIIGPQGNLLIDLRCSATARNHWYRLSGTADQIMP